MKIYVQEKVEKDDWGFEAIVIQVYRSKPRRYDYIIFL